MTAEIVAGACGALSNGTGTLGTQGGLWSLGDLCLFRIEAAWAAFEYSLTYVIYTSF